MTMERIFSHFKDGESPKEAVYDPKDPDSYAAYIKSMMGDARDYEDAFLAVDRNHAQLYYYGMEPWIGPYNPGSPYIGEDPNATLGEILNKENDNQANRSTFVSTDVRDAVMMMLPSLVRLFGASEAPVALVPRSEGEVDQADQATDYVNYVFWNDNPGFLTLYGAFKDALTVKTGFVKWWSDTEKEKQTKTFENITAEQIQLIISEDSSARLVEVGRPIPNQAPDMGQPPALPPNPASNPFPGGGPNQFVGAPQGPAPGPMVGSTPGGPGLGAPSPNAGLPSAGPPMGPPPPPPPIYDKVTIEFEKSKPLIKVAGVPPEEMRLDRYARTFRDSRIVGHERIVPVDQLTAMGYDREKCLEHIQTSESAFTTEPQLRNPGRFMGTRLGNGVKYGEWYIRIDKDGDGTPELRYICTFGEKREIMHDEPANRIKFALFSCDPISHTIVGDSLADYTEDIQRIKTNMMRAILDSAAESINPKTVINELMVTVEDALNDDLGAVIRTRGDPGNSVMFTSTPFLGQQALPVVEMLNEVLQRRTGLSDAAKGLDPKALQSSTMLGVEAVINGAQERTELVARVLCETGFKDLFTGLYNEICENPNQRRTLKIRGKFVPYDTGTFDASMAVEVNANLGKGSDMTRMLALNQIKQDQQLVFTQFGPGNPVVGIPEMLNTISDMMAIANIKNVGRYFKTPTPQQLQAIQAQPKTPDAMTMAAQAQMEKVRSDTAKAVGQQQLDRERMQAEGKFKYDQLQAKTNYDMQKLQIEAQKSGADPAQIEREMQLEEQKAQHDMEINQAKMASDQQIAQQKAENDMIVANQKASSAHQIGMLKANSGHQIGMANAHSQHQLGQQKIQSQHVLGALAAENQGGDE